MQMEEEKDFAFPAEDEDMNISCAQCNQAFEDMTFEQVIYLEDCGHFVCKNCLKQRIIDQYPEVFCPKDDCGKHIYDY